MTIGPNWIFLHIPKSGGSAVEKFLEIMLAKQRLGIFHWLARFGVLFPSRFRRMLREVYPDHIRLDSDKYSDTPQEHKNKTAIVAYRLPHDKLVSEFFYFPGWMTHSMSARRKFLMKTLIMPALPDFPNHSFESWVRFCQGARVDKQLRDIGILRDELAVDVGLVSLGCIRMLFKNPDETLRTMNQDYFISGRYKKDMCDFVKVRTENLNEDLYHALIDLGVRPVHARFLLRTKMRVNVGKKRRGRDWREHYNEDLLDYVLKKEWIWFQMFPEHLEQLKEAFPGYFARNTVKIDAGN